MYRITIETLKPAKEPGGYDSWKEIYQQEVENLDISRLIVSINEKDGEEIINVF